MKPTKERLFYFDCEWVPISETFGLLETEHPEIAEIFEHQVAKWNAKLPMDWDMNEWWLAKSHLSPEYCKIIVISYGYFHDEKFVLKSLYGENEKKILEGFNNILDKVFQGGYSLCGYAIKRFDMPWVSKRSMVNGVKPHSSVCVYGKKPWDVDVFDLPEVWGQGSMGESYTPFEVACTALGIKSSKGDLSGDKVKVAYWNGEIERIKTYCELDVEKTKELAVKLIELMP